MEKYKFEITLKDSFHNTEGIPQILCPICKFEYVHFCENGNALYKASDDSSAWRYGRGGALTIPMSCENGHEWDLVLGHHKGYSFVMIDNEREIKYL